MRNPVKWIGEMLVNFDVSRSAWFGPSFSALRSMFAESFWQKPIMQGSSVNYDLARSIYRNDANDYVFGSGFAKPIIDLAVEYMGIPSVSGTPYDAFLNECITDYWAPELQQIFRDSMRDSKVIVRYRQPLASNKLMDERDRTHGRLQVIPPEEVDLTFDPTDYDLVIRAIVTHHIKLDDRSKEEVIAGTAPRQVEHEILEIVTPEDYTFYDKTASAELESWGMANGWGFVPFWSIWNEYSAELGGGISDFESVLPFLQAFHDVFEQTLTAHKYHSTPKARFNVKDIYTFIKNNFPEAIDGTTKQIKPNAKISYSGREIMFFSPDEEAGFIEAKSVLGDSKTLLDFLIDCIAISSETPRWALLDEKYATTETDASVAPFVKKIGRKRIAYNDCLVILCKMALAATGKRAWTPRINWAPVRLLDLVSKGQAIQQLILGFDAAAAHQWLSDRTIVHILGTLFDEVSDPDEEMAAAKNNVEVAAPAAPPSPTQGAQPTNGKASTAAATRVLTTTAASRS